MEKTHYEKMIETDRFNVKELLRLLDEEISGDSISFDDFTQTSIMQSLVSNVSHLMPLNDLNTLAQVVFHVFSFNRGAGRVYEVKENMAEMLLNTKLDVDTSVVKSPFPEVVLVVPDNLLQVYAKSTGMHAVYNLYVNFRELSDSYKELKVLCVGRPNGNSMDEYDDGLFFFKIPLKEGKISESLKDSMVEWRANPLSKVYSSVNDTEYLPRIFHFVLNILLYITSQDSDIRLEKSKYEEFDKKLGGLKSVAKIRKLSKKLEKESKIHRFIVGGSMTLSNEEKGLYGALRASGKHSIRYPVGGHWRLQWYGPQNEQFQKPKWIRPHFRGPELAELIKSVGVIK